MAFYRSGGGGSEDKIYIEEFEVEPAASNSRVWGSLTFYDVSKYNTLKIGSVTEGTGNKSNVQFQIRDYVGGGSTYTYTYSVTNDEQVFDISNFTILRICCSFSSSTAWKSVVLHDITIE